MQPADLVRMSTQIAQFFEPYPLEEAIVGVAEHIRGFWTPSMRQQLIAIHAAGSPALHPLVAQATARITAGSAA